MRFYHRKCVCARHQREALGISGWRGGQDRAKAAAADVHEAAGRGVAAEIGSRAQFLPGEAGCGERQDNESGDDHCFGQWILRHTC
jgi:hypothetical protein